VVFEWHNLVYLQPLQKNSEFVGQNLEVKFQYTNQYTNLLCPVEQMNGVCELLCELLLLFLVMQEVLGCCQSYQKVMHVLTSMGEDWRRGEDSG